MTAHYHTRTVGFVGRARYWWRRWRRLPVIVDDSRMYGVVADLHGVRGTVGVDVFNRQVGRITTNTHCPPGTGLETAVTVYQHDPAVCDVTAKVLAGRYLWVEGDVPVPTPSRLRSPWPHDPAWTVPLSIDVRRQPVGNGYELAGILLVNRSGWVAPVREVPDVG